MQGRTGVTSSPSLCGASSKSSSRSQGSSHLPVLFACVLRPGAPSSETAERKTRGPTRPCLLQPLPPRLSPVLWTSVSQSGKWGNNGATVQMLEGVRAGTLDSSPRAWGEQRGYLRPWQGSQRGPWLSGHRYCGGPAISGNIWAGPPRQPEARRQSRRGPEAWRRQAVVQEGRARLFCLPFDMRSDRAFTSKPDLLPGLGSLRFPRD